LSRRPLSPTLALALLGLAGCSDYDLNGQTAKPSDAFDTGSPAPDETATTEDSTPLDTVADTASCNIAEPAASSVPILDTCTGDVPREIEDPWNVGVEWDYNSGGTGVIVMPAIGNLTDDNGDGAVDEDDQPDVAFTEWAGYLTALNGADGSVFVRLSGFNGNAGVTVADVTGDGVPEMIALDSRGSVEAVSGDGTVEWVSPVLNSLSPYPQPAVADLDNDGDAEVVYDNAVLNGQTGALQARLTAGMTTSWRTPVIADLDLDGTREILLGNVTYAPDGTVLWTNSGTGAGDFAAVADIDGDPEGEALFVSGSELLEYDSDGTRIRDIHIPGSNPGPPSVADFDGDGEVEIAIPANTTISVYDMDGTKLWSSAMQDSSGLAGCSGFDVNGDGAYEVLFADELALRMYDGKTGAILYENTSTDSQTLWEYPVVADIDNDGSAEIAVASNLYHGGALGVTVFGHAGDGWPKSGPTWGTHDFAITNLGQDGSVPTDEDPSWQVYNVFRARPSVDSPGAADLYVDLEELCITGCDPGDVVQISYQVGNQGSIASTEVTLSLYATYGSTETLLGTATIPAVDPGYAPPGGVFTLDAAQLAGADGYVARLEGVSGSDCDDTNHESRSSLGVCP